MRMGIVTTIEARQTAKVRKGCSWKKSWKMCGRSCRERRRRATAATRAAHRLSVLLIALPPPQVPPAELDEHRADSCEREPKHDEPWPPGQAYAPHEGLRHHDGEEVNGHPERKGDESADDAHDRGRPSSGC